MSMRTDIGFFFSQCFVVGYDHLRKLVIYLVAMTLATDYAIAVACDYTLHQCSLLQVE